jgi:hypothetical protein
MRAVASTLLTLVLMASGCSSDSGEASTPTANATPTSGEVIIEAMFDGEECSLGDTTEVTAGDYAFVMTSSVPKAVDVAVQPVPGGVTWDEYATANAEGASTEYAGAGEATVSFSRLPDDLSDNQRARRYLLDQGDYGIWAMRNTPPTVASLCGRLIVTE